MLSYSQSQNLADVYPDVLHCWKAPSLETLLTCYLSRYIAELFPNSPSYYNAQEYFIIYTAEIFPIL